MAKEEKNTEMELLKAQIELLQKQVPKAAQSEIEFQERVKKYEASKEKREAMKQEIEKEKMLLWSSNPKLRSDEVHVIVGMQRRIKEIESSNPAYVMQLKNAIKLKIKNANEDISR